ncbi:MAG: hemolysin family protein, partial [Bacteroidota bacterium]
LDPDSIPRVEALLQHAQLAEAGLTSASALDVFFQGLPVALCLLATAFLSASGAALFALDGGVRSALMSEPTPANARISRLLEHPRRFLATLLLLTTLARLGTVVSATVLLLAVLIPLGWSLPAVVGTIVGTAALLVLVLGELGPRWLGTRHAYPMSRLGALVLLPLHRLLHPLSKRVAHGLKAALRQAEATLPRRISNDDLKALVQLREADGSLEVDERELISSFIAFGDTTVREIMTSRLDVVGVPLEATLFEAATIVEESGHSRLPIYEEHLDSVLGILYAKDLLPYLSSATPSAPSADWKRLARSPMLVAPDMNLTDLLREFKARQTHIALVVDEYGGTAGLVTMEDVLEEIVGDILDEHDQNEEAWLEPLGPHAYRVDARMNLDELSDELNLELDTDQFDFETLGGLIMDETGAVPEPGDELHYQNLTLCVETVDNHRIGTVRVNVQSEDAPTASIEERRAL